MHIRSFIKFNYDLFQWSLSYPIRPSKRLTLMRDYQRLYKTKGLTTDEYYEYEFEKCSESFRNSFLGLNEQRHYLDLLNPMKYYILARNKFVAHKMLENTGVRKSQLFCYYQPEGRVDGSTEIASDVEGVCRILKSKNVESCVIKFTEDSHGDNVWVIKKVEYQENDALLTRFDGKGMRLSEILKGKPAIFEGVVKQTRQFASFNESSVNTVRIMTTLYPDGSAKVIAAFIKIGRVDKCVDNAGSGGNVDACIDTDTGEIKYAVQFDGWRKIKDIDCHPDSGNRLVGVVIDNWESIKAEVIGFQQAFPYCKAAGWDIAITDEGSTVIEVNDFWDRTGQRFIRKGWRDEIRDCYLAWKNEGRGYAMCRQRNDLTLRHLLKIANHG